MAYAETEWDAVIVAAKKEGRVVLYHSNVGQPYYRTFSTEFQKRYGIRVEILEARPAELRERIRSEQAAGRFAADVSLNGSSTVAGQARDGIFQPLGALSNLTHLRDGFVADEFTVPIFTTNFGLLVNTDIVKPAEEPKNWSDLLDPKWRGKILADDFRFPGTGHVFFAMTYQKIGREFQEKLARQDLRFSREPREDERRCARGEFPLYLPVQTSSILQLDGLPIKLIVPGEGVPYGMFLGSVLKNAPNPNAARLFINFLLSPEAQFAYGAGGLNPVIKGVVERLPEKLRPALETKLMGTVTPDISAPMIAAAKDIYGS
ncbi:ABC transporter substrate-binding protein [Bradyrhizobium sp. HKCCYLR20261]|uniref:ABC transporter substrate-binding protein n=1 Tax=unclassified Bradyrhizobium TaxID=2631580 RepID=UPI003EBF2142